VAPTPSERITAECIDPRLEPARDAEVEDFKTRVLPQVVAAWERSCFCRSPGFLKLMSFDSRDYGHSAQVLYDVELIGEEIIYRKFTMVSDWGQDSNAPDVSVVACPKCGTRCARTTEQYTMGFWCSWFRFDTGVAKADVGLYLTGFYWLGKGVPIPDYRRAVSIQDFMKAITG
jgi:hypothetical protein